MKQRIIFLFLIMCFALESIAQSSISGKITHSETHEPVPFANITLNQTKGTVSNEDGIYQFTELKEGTYNLRITYLGYETVEQQITLKDNEQLTVNIALEPALFTADEVVITATKTENYVKDVPARVHMISPRQMEALPAQTIDDIIATLPGVNINRSFGIFTHSASVTMRGLNGEEQGRVLVLIDGIPTNKSDGGSVNWNLLNTDQVERIEVVKGPGSSLYGGNAMGGAINIITKKPTEPFSGKASIAYGTYNTIHGQLNLSGRMSKKTNQGLFWNINSFYRQSDGYITASEADQLANPYIVESELMEWAATAKLGYDFNKDHGVEVSFMYYDDDRGTGEKVYQPEGNNREHDTYHLRAKYYGEKNNLNWKVNLFYLNEDYKRISEWLKDDYTFYKVLSERVDLGALTSLSYQWNKQTFTGGIDLKQGSVDAKDVYYTSTDVVYNRGKMNMMGLFLQDEILLMNDKLKIVAGVRFDYANFFDGGFEIENPTAETTFMTQYDNANLSEDTWQAFSPKLSAQYEFNARYRIYASYAKGFRPAVLDDMCRSGRIKGGFKVADQSLQPEYINNFEIGADARFFNRFRTSFSTYYSLGDDFMYYVNTGDSIDLGYGMRPIIKASNISEVEIYGLELELNYLVTEKIRLNANYAYAHSQIKEFTPLSSSDPVDLTQKYLTEVPDHMGSVSFYWRNSIVNTSIIARYMGERWVNDLNQVDEIVLDDQYPAYSVVDLRFSKQIKHLFIHLSFQNIFDQKHYDRKGAVSPGRFITLELGTKF
ncbi:MAG: TonB-dependent receptor [Bacteroidales bacterium]|jgi:iron complex outermembrane receptor protein|nr:TonB-dependent receptor [Bacteroidales bacterium]